MRDIGFYAVSLAGVTASFASGKLTRWFVALALFLYFVYALWVFLGDEWHERGRPRPAGISWSQIKAMLSRGNQLKSNEAPQWASLDPVHEDSISTHLLSREGEERRRPSSALLMDSHTYRDAVWADLGHDTDLLESVKDKVESGQALAGERPGIQNEVEMEAGFRPLVHHEVNAGPSEAEASVDEATSHDTPTLWGSICSELTLGESREWHHLPLLRRHWRLATFKVRV